MPDENVQVKGPDGKTYAFPKGTTKESAIGYFKKKGIGAAPAAQTSAPGAKGSGAVGALGDVAVGFGKGVMETVNTVSKGLNKIPGIGETLAPKEGIAAVDKMTESQSTAQSVGKAGEVAAEYAAGEGALKTLVTALKVKNVGMVASLVRKYPWLSKVAVSGMKNYVLGAGSAAAHGEDDPGTSGAIAAVAGMAGEGVASKLEKSASKALPKTYDAVNDHLGLSKGNLPKWERGSIGDVRDVGKTVMQHGALKGSVEETHIAVEMARERVQQQTENLVGMAVGSRAVPVHAELSNINQKVAKHFLDMGKDINGVTTNASNSIYNEFKGITNPNMSAKEAFALKKKIGSQIDWNNLKGTENVRQMFLGELYSSLDDHIEQALPGGAGKMYGQLNRTHNRLIIARQASGAKIVADSMKEAHKPGLASRAATVATHAAVGAVGGALVGAGAGHTTEGAEGGAVIGAISGARGEVRLPRADIAVRKGMATASKAMAAAARKSPALARAIESATASQGGGSGSINQQQ